VPLIVITSADQAAVTPAGNPEALPMPVALVVACVIFVNTVFTVSVGVDDAAPAEQAATGVTALEVADADELPNAFVAITVKV
jgi:hypothetical protein